MAKQGKVVHYSGMQFAFAPLTLYGLGGKILKEVGCLKSKRNSVMSLKPTLFPQEAERPIFDKFLETFPCLHQVLLVLAHLQSDPSSPFIVMLF
jgi:hypothetical protein